MAVSANIFTKCTPAIGSNIATCGSVTSCDIVRAEADTLASIFTDGSGNMRNMQSLLVADFEIKACGTKTNSLYDLLMANKRIKQATVRKKGATDWEQEPFILADQQSVFNNVHWAFTGGTAPGGGNDWRIDCMSPGGAPLDVRWFEGSQKRVFLNGLNAGGIVIRAAYRVTAASIAGSTVRLNLVAQNSTFGAAPKVNNPTSGFLTVGAPNVSDYENYCYQIPGVNLTKSVPFWIETQRYSMCRDEFYEKWFKELVMTNPYFEKFGDIPLAKLNAQIAANFQQEWVNSFFWSKRISANQTLDAWRSLDNITTASVADLYIPGEGRCVGKRANIIGVYEQLQECERVDDLFGQPLNLPELFDLIYDLSRARGDQGGNGKQIDIFTDRATRGRIQRAMIAYYDTQFSNAIRYNVNVAQEGTLGFNYDQYKLIDPAGVVMNVISNEFFDDFKSQASASGIGNAGNMLWILDFAGIYPAIVASNRVVNKTGDIRDLAKVDYNYACVMKNPTQEVTLNSITWAAVVECPRNSYILEGFSDTVPTSSGKVGSYDDYYGA